MALPVMKPLNEKIVYCVLISSTASKKNFIVETFHSFQPQLLPICLLIISQNLAIAETRANRFRVIHLMHLDQ